MRRFLLFLLCGVVGCLLFSTAALAGGPNAAGYPLRVHIYENNQTVHFTSGQFSPIASMEGRGRANLYEDGQPLGFEYSFQCGSRLSSSAGYETYMARWKKKNRTLEILLPVLGKPRATESCELRVEMEAFAYFLRNGALATEPGAKYKEWMNKCQYDPEEGKNTPVPETCATTLTPERPR